MYRRGTKPIRLEVLGLSIIYSIAMVSGCGMAQQGELRDVERNLTTKITKLDQRDKELQQTVKQAKVDVDKLVNEARARLSQEISTLREQELPALRGGLDKDSHQMATLRARVEDLERQLRKHLDSTPVYASEENSSVDGPTLKTLQGRLDAQETVLSDLLRQVMSLKQAVERDKR
jgi:hypothetical protein